MKPSRTLTTAVVTGAVVVAALVALVVQWPEADESADAGTPDAAVTTSNVPPPVHPEPAPPETATPDTAAPTTPPASTPSGAGGVVDPPADSFLIATPTRDIDGFAEPDGEPTGTVAASWHDRPSHLPVIDQAPGWLQVRLPQRPNGSTAWIRRDDAELATTPYRIEIDVATMRLKLYDHGDAVVDAPAGIGTDAAPTTVGNFFVTFLQEPPDTTSGWGPFVMVTSSHSETISDFQSSGDAIAAIHGPLGKAAEIGTTGAQVSHGCVRLHLDNLEKLRAVPPGSPIDVIDSSTPAEASA